MQTKHLAPVIENTERKKIFTNSIASIFVREMATSAVEIYHFHEMVHFSVQIRDVDMQIFVGNCCQSVSYTLINIFFWNCSFSIFLILLWCWNVWRHITSYNLTFKIHNLLPWFEIIRFILKSNKNYKNLCRSAQLKLWLNGIILFSMYWLHCMYGCIISFSSSW